MAPAVARAHAGDAHETTNIPILHGAHQHPRRRREQRHFAKRTHRRAERADYALAAVERMEKGYLVSRVAENEFCVKPFGPFPSSGRARRRYGPAGALP
jgi:hypothetical protein